VRLKRIFIFLLNGERHLVNIHIFLVFFSESCGSFLLFEFFHERIVLKNTRTLWNEGLGWLRVVSFHHWISVCSTWYTWDFVLNWELKAFLRGWVDWGRSSFESFLKLGKAGRFEARWRLKWWLRSCWGSKRWVRTKRNTILLSERGCCKWTSWWNRSRDWRKAWAFWSCCKLNQLLMLLNLMHICLNDLLLLRNFILKLYDLNL